MTPNANLTGKNFETMCVDVIKRYRNTIEEQTKVNWSPRNYYKPDLVTESEVIEFKYQQVGGSVKNKLTQAIFELEYIAKKLNKSPVLVYEGKVLHHFIHNDPAFLVALECCPNVTLISFNSLDDYFSPSIDCNNWQQDRLLEYAA